ncbi:hypothetical protein EYZ11_012228 [Aspergillus tanneri]|uniref:Uncharacterized protein n=1 Tax=Aspergillus tanneri TaxID=1220188 RepID=A0A4S3J1C8_9EURO|nr:hypothetical protein EYZ11_012228 [Aspergillus tanneri]
MYAKTVEYKKGAPGAALMAALGRTEGILLSLLKECIA